MLRGSEDLDPSPIYVFMPCELGQVAMTSETKVEIGFSGTSLFNCAMKKLNFPKLQS